MRRREFLALAALTAPQLAFAQQSKVWRIAVVSNALPADRLQAVFDGLADGGYSVGQNLHVDVFDSPTLDGVPAQAAAAVASKPNVIVTYASSAPLAVKQL